MSTPQASARRAAYAEAEEFLMVNEIAAILKINPQTVRNWIEGETPGAADRPAGEGARRGVEALLAQSEMRPSGRPSALAEALWTGTCCVACG